MGVFLSFEFMTLCGKGGHSRPLAATREKRPLAATRVAASGCFCGVETPRPRVEGGHLRSVATERPLAATCGHSGKAATCGHSSGCKRLQVAAAFYEIETPRPRVEGGHLRSLAATRQSGHLRPLKLRPLERLRVAASGCFSEIQIPRRMQPQWKVIFTDHWLGGLCAARFPSEPKRASEIKKKST